MLADLIPNIVSTGALGLVFWGIRAQRAEMMKNIEKIEKEYLPRDTHDNLSKIQYYELKELMVDKITELKDSIFPELRDIKDRLPKNAKDK